jgi:hypothetical protein
MTADRIIRWSTALAVLGVAVVAAVASYEHAYDLVRAHGLGHGPTGAVVAAWPAVALVGSYELLMMIIRSAHAPADPAAEPGAFAGLGGDPLQAQAAEEFAGEVAAGCVPSVRAIRARLHVGQPRAQRVRAYLAALSNAQRRPNPALGQADATTSASSCRQGEQSRLLRTPG